MIKTFGYQYKQFINDDWGQNICDDVYLLVNGEEYEDDENLIADDAKVVIDGGVVYTDPNMDQELCSYESYFRRWRKAQTQTTVMVNVPLDKLEEFKKMLKDLNARIVHK